MPTAEEARLRQAERTIDNMKRLYAVLFALSFGVLANGTLAKLAPFSAGESFDARVFLVHLEMTLSFVITAGLFYYQGDRFLDIGHAQAPLFPASRAAFGADYLVNVLTMVPFYLMAHALSATITEESGFLWYFLAYLGLISLGLCWLLIREIVLLMLARRTDRLVPLESLKAFWFLMNTIMLIVVLGVFHLFRSIGGDPCPTNLTGTTGGTFIVTLGCLILARDALDYVIGWNILFPAGAEPRPLKLLATERARQIAWGCGLLLFIVLAWLIAGLFAEFPKFAAACALDR